jgi:hypothetical protein
MLAVPMVTGGLGATASMRTIFVTLEAPGNEKRPLPAEFIVRSQMIVFAPEGSAATVKNAVGPAAQSRCQNE